MQGPPEHTAMGEVTTHQEIDLSQPVLIEGLPGVGLVGKIAVDHLIEQFEMVHCASIRCTGVPQMGTYQTNSWDVLPPVRVYADAKRDLLALQSDVPISPTEAPDFAPCVVEWFTATEAAPVYVSGLPTGEEEREPTCFGVATGSMAGTLEELGVEQPDEDGAITGPTGALLAETAQRELDSVTLIVETDPNFPDPEAARVAIEAAIEPIADVDADVSALVDQAEEIQETREELAAVLKEVDEDEATSASPQPLRMFQ